MSLYRRGKTYWTSFSVNGIPFRKSLRTKVRQEAIVAERELIRQAETGNTSGKTNGPKKLGDAIERYLEHRRLRRRTERTAELDVELLSTVRKYFGDSFPLRAITVNAIEQFQRLRAEPPATHISGMLTDGISSPATTFKSPHSGQEIKSRAKNRTINMNVAALGRVLKFTGHWKALANHIEKLPEAETQIGVALTPTQERRLMETAASRPEWEHIYNAAVVAAHTSLRRVEVMNLRRRDVDEFKKLIHIRRTKNASGHRTIPLDNEALKAILRMLDRLKTVGSTSPDHYLWFACQWEKPNPEKPIQRWDTAWRSLRKEAGLPGLRFHDLRHTFITKMAETDVPDAVLQSIVGHLSRKMLDHYSHIRLHAKRRAIAEFEKRSQLDFQEAEADEAGREAQ